MQILPDNILKCMNAEDRRLYAKGQLTAEQAIERHCAHEEKELHKNFENWCLRHRHYLGYSHSRMDKATTTKVGLSDFHVWSAKAHCFVEFKSEHGTLSKAQEAFIGEQERLGVPVLVTTDYLKAINFVTSALFPDQMAMVPGKPLIEVLTEPAT